MKFLGFILSLTLASASAARGDLLYFAKGGRAELATKKVGKSITVQGPNGPLVFEESDFVKIVARPTVAEEWPERWSKAKKGTVDDRFAAAWWALENGLTPEAVSSIRFVHAEDPGHSLAQRLVRALDAWNAPISDPPNLLETEKSAGVELRRESGRLAIVFHQSDPAWARDRIDLIERVATTFLLVFTARGMDLHPPRHKLVSIWYREQGDYIAFLNRSDAGAFRTTQGYFHPTRNVIAGFEAASTSSHRKGLEALARRRLELDGTAASIEAIPKGARIKIATSTDPARIMTRTQAQTWLEKSRKDLARPELILELDRRAVDLGLTAHETVHHLVMNTGFAHSHASFPTWLNEGLAAQFEVVRGGVWAGFGRSNDQRLPDWRTQVPGPRLAPLLRDEGFDQGYRRDLYAQAWALVYFLRLQYPDKFITFLDRLRLPSPNNPDRSPAVVVQIFREVVGELPEQEALWHRTLRPLQAPLEEFDPTRKSAQDRR